MGLLSDTQNYGLRMRRECRERFPRHRLQRKPLVSDPGMHHDTVVTHVPWCMSGSLNFGGGENVPRIPGACATRNFAYLIRWLHSINSVCTSEKANTTILMLTSWLRSSGQYMHLMYVIDLNVYSVVRNPFYFTFAIKFGTIKQESFWIWLQSKKNDVHDDVHCNVVSHWPSQYSESSGSL